MAEPALTLLTSLGLSYLAYSLTARLVPLLGSNLVAKGLGGYDMLKPAYSAKRDDDAQSRKQIMLFASFRRYSAVRSLTRSPTSPTDRKRRE